MSRFVVYLLYSVCHCISQTRQMYHAQINHPIDYRRLLLRQPFWPIQLRIIDSILRTTFEQFGCVCKQANKKKEWTFFDNLFKIAGTSKIHVREWVRKLKLLFYEKKVHNWMTHRHFSTRCNSDVLENGICSTLNCSQIHYFPQCLNHLKRD